MSLSPFAEKTNIGRKIFLAHFTLWVAETIYDYKSQAPKEPMIGKSMARGEDQSTPSAGAEAEGRSVGTRS